MSVEWFDLGQRLKASVVGAPVPKLCGAPLVPVPHPVAVRVSGRADRVRVSVATDTATDSGMGMDGLAALGRVGASLDSLEAWTLLIDSRAALPVLIGLARRCSDAGLEAVAALVGWWWDRADFPGGRAVVNVVDGCRARWVTGRAPQSETAKVWLAAFGLPDSAQGLVGLHRLLVAGDTLPMLDLLAADDEFSHSVARTALSDGSAWSRPDSVARAAVGLRSRCDAADLYGAALLADPLWRARQTHAGEVVTGRLVNEVTRGQWVVRVESERLDARLRVGADVRVWNGLPGDVDGPGRAWAGVVRDSAVVAGRLVLTVRLGVRTATIRQGEVLTLMPAPPSVYRQRSGRSTYRRLAYSRSSWLSTGRPPSPTRRSVPLDVLLAGAEDVAEPGGGC